MACVSHLKASLAGTNVPQWIESEPCKPKPIANAVPTYLQIEAGTASRRLNSLWLVKDRACQTSRRRLPRFGSFRLLHFATQREKIAYILPNTPTPCPPPSAVLVNHWKSCIMPYRTSGKNSVRNATRSCDVAAEHAPLGNFNKPGVRALPSPPDFPFSPPCRECCHFS